MTPKIYKRDVDARPLYDPDPNTFVIHTLVIALAKDNEFCLVRISDWLAGAVELAVAEKKIRKNQAELFQTPYVKGVKFRKLRYHEGLPFLAPDGSPMLIQGQCMDGGQDLGIPNWTITSDNDDPRSVKNCPVYVDWRDRILQTHEVMIGAGGTLEDENGPLAAHQPPPDEEGDEPKLNMANEASPTPERATPDPDDEPFDYIVDCNNKLGAMVKKSFQHVERKFDNPDTRKRLYDMLESTLESNKARAWLATDEPIEEDSADGEEI
jgi:hypothetical protein